MVSNEEDDLEPLPAHITIETHSEPSNAEFLLNALADKKVESPSSLDLEPLPLEAAVPIEFHDSDLGASFHQDDLLDFCNAMGVSC